MNAWGIGDRRDGRGFDTRCLSTHLEPSWPSSMTVTDNGGVCPPNKSPKIPRNSPTVERNRRKLADLCSVWSHLRRPFVRFLLSFFSAHFLNLVVSRISDHAEAAHSETRSRCRSRTVFPRSRASIRYLCAEARYPGVRRESERLLSRINQHTCTAL